LLESTRRDQRQAAYQILVAGSEEKLKQDIGDLWDSGKVVSDKSVNIPYQGRALTSGQECWWKLRGWNKPGYDGFICEAPYIDKRSTEELHKERPSEYSAPATFEMGLLKKSDWQGKWICADKNISAPLLRKEFKIDKKIKQAKVYISGLGYYELYINGQKVGDHVLDPGSTYYNNDQPFEIGSRVLYVTYDVTDHLKIGQNAVGVMLGNGCYSAEDDIPPSPSGKLVAQMMPPIKVIKTFKPVRLLNPKEGVYVYDFGQTISGWTRLRVKGPKGTKVTIKHAIRVYEDGSLDARSNLFDCPDSQEDYRRGKGKKGRWHHVARQTETYILKGQGQEI